jgi:uncharacterized protein YqeY
MGELLKQLRKENMQALKDHDTVKKGVLSMVISAIALGEKEAGKELSKADELAYVQKELKQQRESLAETPADRTEIIAETNQKIALLESYLPKQLGEDEIRAAIEKIMQENSLEPVKKSQGVIMKNIMAQYKGQVDGKKVSQILGTILK